MKMHERVAAIVECLEDMADLQSKMAIQYSRVNHLRDLHERMAGKLRCLIRLVDVEHEGDE